MAFVPPGLRVFGLPPGSNEENLFTLKPLLVYAAVYPCIVYNTWKIKLLRHITKLHTVVFLMRW